MHRKTRTVAQVAVALLLCGILLAGQALAQSRPRVVPAPATGKIEKPPARLALAARLPVDFAENRGQTAKVVRYLARGRGFNLFLTPDEAVLALARVPTKGVPDRRSARGDGRRGIEMSALRLRFEGARSDVRLSGGNRLKAAVHHYRGRDRRRWLTDIATFANVHYRGLYPGIDLHFTADGDRLAYALTLAPGADPRDIAISILGAERLAVNREGDLVISLAGQTLRLAAPRLYQWRTGRRQPVSGGYRLKGSTLRFQVGRYDRDLPLHIDPDIVFSAWLYGSADESGFPGGITFSEFDKLGLAVRATGGSEQAFVAAGTQSSDFPAPGTTTYVAGWDAFVLALDVTGPSPLPIGTTYIGGSGNELASDLTVDDSGQIYVIGHTGSDGDFPLAGGPVLQAGYGGGDYDAFLVRLNPDLTLASASYLGGSNHDFGHAITSVPGPEPAAGLYIAGASWSTDMHSQADPTGQVVPLRPHGGLLDAYVAKLDLAASGFAYFTYLGGSNGDEAEAITVRDGAAYVTGYTHGLGFPDINALQRCASGLQPQSNGNCPQTIPGLPPNYPHRDAFVARINAAGDDITFASRLGGSRREQSYDIAVDSAGRAYIAGEVEAGSGTFPSKGTPIDDQGTPSSGNGYFAVLDPVGPAPATTPVDPTSDDRLIYAARTGGRSLALYLDSGGRVYLGGTDEFSTVTPPFNGTTSGRAFVAALAASDPDAWALSYWARLGGSSFLEAVVALAPGPPGSLFAAGHSRSDDFSAGVPQQGQRGGGGDLFLLRLDVEPPPPGIALGVAKSDGTFDPVIQGQQIEYQITVSNAGPADATGVTVTDNLPPGTLFVGTDPVGCSVAAGTVTCPIGDLPAGAAATVTIAVTAAAPLLGSIENQVFVSANEPEAELQDNSAIETTEVLPPPVVLTVAKSGSLDLASGAVSYDIDITNQGPPTAEAVVVTDTLPAGFTVTNLSSPLCATSGPATVTCNIAQLPPLLPVVFSIEGTVSPLLPGTEICNAVTVAADNADGVSDTSCAEVPAEEIVLTVEKQMTPDFAAGTLTYDIFVTHVDGPAAQGLAVTDELPAELQVTGLSPGNCTLQANMQTVVCPLGDLAPGSGAFVSIEAAFDPPIVDSIEICNIAAVTAVGTDPLLAEHCFFTPKPELAVSVTAPPLVESGAEFDLLATVQNIGLIPAYDVTLELATDPPKLVDLLGSNPDQGLCDLTEPYAGRCQLGDIAPGSSVDVTFPSRAAGFIEGANLEIAQVLATTATAAFQFATEQSLEIAGVSTDLTITTPSVTAHDTDASRIDILATASPVPAPLLRVEVQLFYVEDPVGGGSAFAEQPNGTSQPCIYTDLGPGAAQVFCSVNDASEVNVGVLLPIPPAAISSIAAAVSGAVVEPPPDLPNTAAWP